MDGIVLSLETFFVVNKFISIFSFLFGVGLALQLSRVRGGVSPFVRMYSRRMGWLLAIGACHAVLVWYGDILHLYAVLGVGLLVASRLPHRVLLPLGLGLALLGPTLVDAALLALPRLTDGAFDPASAFDAKWDAAAAHRNAFANGSYIDIVRANMADLWAWLSTDDAASTGLASLGKFMLGLWVGRSGILSRAGLPGDPGFSTSDRHVLTGLGLLSLLGGAATQTIAMKDLLASDNAWVNLADSTLWNVGVVAMATAYVCGIALGYRTSVGRRWLNAFAPVGRTALTNYMAQSVICVLVFHSAGFGLYGRVGPMGSLGVAVLVFATQTAISAAWLRSFQFGPAEWLWRSLTYGQVQQFRTTRSAA